MAVADTISSMKEHLSDAYDKIEEKGVDITENKNLANLPSVIDKIETDDWKPQSDWWDIKKIVEEDEEDYSTKIIVLFDESNKNFVYDKNNFQNLGIAKIKLSDGQILKDYGIYTVKNEGLKECSKGYQTFYAIFYLWNMYTDFKGGGSLMNFFPNSRYIYIKGLETIYWAISFSGSLLEAIESDKKIAIEDWDNFNLDFYSSTLRKIPNLVYTRHYKQTPNIVNFSNMPFLPYEEIKNKLTKNFEYISGTMPEISNAFYGETIDFENDFGIDTSLFTKTNNLIGPYAIKKLDLTNVTSFNGNINVCEIYDISNIKISNSYFKYSPLSHDTLIRILNALYDYSDSPDTYTLTLGSTNLEKLTDYEKSIATEKGWTLA